MSAVLTPTDGSRHAGDGAAGDGGGADGGGADAPARASAWVALAAVLVAVVFAPPADDGLARGEFGRVLAGAVEVDRGGTWERLGEGAAVPDGARLRTTDADAELQVRDGRLSLSRWALLDVDDPAVVLTRGELLLEADRAYEVTSAAIAGEGRGAWRVSSGGAPRFAVYDGGVAVRQPGVDEPVAVAAYREVPVAGGTADAPRPLRYLPTDPWDARLLAEAIRIDRLLEATRRGLAVRYGAEPQTSDFYADFTRFGALLPHLSSLALESRGDRYGPPGETLVALLVAEAVVGTGVAADEAARRIDALRAAGASWGIVARQHGLTAGDLDATLERAVRRRGEAVAGGTAAPVAGPPEPAPTIDPAPPPPDDPDAPDDPGDPTGPPPTPPDPGPEEPGPLDPVTDPVADAVDDLGSLLDEVVPGASDVTDTVNDTLEDVADTVDDLLP